MEHESEIGSAVKRREFSARHGEFFRRGASLHVATSVAFDRPLPDEATELDKIIFYLGVRAVADFGAITLLAANGSGLNAIALVRGLYERVTVASYLCRNPQSAKSFVAYSAVQTYRTLTRLQSGYEFDETERRNFDAVKQWRDEVAERFRREECPSCKRSLMQNWTKVDFVTMAKSISQGC